MIVLALLPLAAMMAQASGGVADVATAAAEARKVLKRCGPVGAKLARRPDTAWRPVDDALPKHHALRSALNEPLTELPTMIAVYGAGGHLETTEFSVIMTRGSDGVWTGTAVGRSKIWIPDAPSNPMPRREWTLVPRDGRRLDAVIGDACFFAEPSGFEQADDAPALGVRYIQLDVATPTRRHHAGFLGGTDKGLTAEVTRLVLPN